MSVEFDNISFNMPKTQSNAIKVIGVGGGGGNAVNHMYSQQINGVDFVICNTDAQALENSPVPNKIQLGASLTSGLGAGANPEIGAQAAKESLQEIQQLLSTHTKMVFITAGMGGGTGTGAAPIIAKIAKDLDILTVGIVTMPFVFEGRRRTKQAQEGIDQLRKNVDSLIVINNNKLREVYGNLGFKAGFSKADEVLSTASRGIAEVITNHYKQNIDLHDAKTVLSNSGTAIMGSAKETGEERAKKAIVKALDSPLLNDNKITGAKNVLLLIISGSKEVTLDEIGEINDFIQDEAGYDANIIMGIGEDDNLDDAISVTVVATGFAADQQHAITNTEVKKIVHTLEDEQKATYSFEDRLLPRKKTDAPINTPKAEQRIVHTLEDAEEALSATSFNLVKTTSEIEGIDVTFTEVTANDTLQLEDDFVINDVTPKVETQEVPKVSKAEEQELIFNLPLNDYEEVTPVKTDQPLAEEITLKTNDIEVFGAEEITANKEVKRYVLDDFDAAPTIGKSSVITSKPIPEEDPSIQFELKTKSEPNTAETDVTVSEDVSPLDLTISQLKARAEERRQKMKGFNHKFTNHLHKNIDELESEPAYKRKGIDLKLDAPISTEQVPINKNDADANLDGKSRNTFLHDNVD